MNQEEIRFQIKNIEIIEFSFHNPMAVIPEETPFRFETNIKHKVNMGDKNIDVATSFNIYRDQDVEAMGKAEVSCVYHVDGLDQYINESGKLTMPKQFVVTLNSISLSTCRGVLFSLFRGTPLHSVILPVIDTSVLDKSAHNQ